MRTLRRRSGPDADQLRLLEVFHGCDDHELRAARGLLTPLDVEAGRTLVHQHDIGREFFIIASGTAEVLRAGESVAQLGAGQFFGEMALLDGKPRTATVRAISAMEVLVQDQREFHAMLHRSPTVACNITRTLSRRLRAA